MKNNNKLMATVIVALMMAVSITPFMETSGSDAIGDGEIYSYTLNYDSQKMVTSAAISVDGMEPISQPSYDGTTVSGYGDWTWDTTTGLGPFNSFYAAFDATSGNSFVAILDPFDLSKTISGEDISSHFAEYNIMWVLPTVYWSSTSTSLTFTNDSTAGGTAYAHTIDGHVYNYVAYGVYEASTTTIDGQTVITSMSDATPTCNELRSTFRTYAHNYTMSDDLATDSDSNPAYSMLWNFYQSQLYKYCCLALMEDFNSQAKVGYGYSHQQNSTPAMTTGTLNSAGPYAGTTGEGDVSNCHDAVKLFIENSWGGLTEFVDGVVIKNGATFYIDSSSTPDDSITEGGNVVLIKQTIVSNGSSSKDIATSSSEVWGCPSYQGGGDNRGTTDKLSVATTRYKPVMVGGYADVNESHKFESGLFSFISTSDLNYKNAVVGSRLAFVFDSISVATEPGGLTLDYTAQQYAISATADQYEILAEGNGTISYAVKSCSSGSATVSSSGAVTFTPPAVSIPTDVTLVITVTDDSQSRDARFSIHVVAILVFINTPADGLLLPATG